jgi:hypothetical protein
MPLNMGVLTQHPVCQSSRMGRHDQCKDGNIRVNSPVNNYGE